MDPNAFLASGLVVLPVLVFFLPIVLIGSRFGLLLLFVDGVELFSPSVIFSVSKESLGFSGPFNSKIKEIPPELDCQSFM